MKKTVFQPSLVLTSAWWWGWRSAWQQPGTWPSPPGTRCSRDSPVWGGRRGPGCSNTPADRRPELQTPSTISEGWPSEEKHTRRPFGTKWNKLSVSTKSDQSADEENKQAFHRKTKRMWNNSFWKVTERAADSLSAGNQPLPSLLCCACGAASCRVSAFIPDALLRTPNHTSSTPGGNCSRQPHGNI